MEKFENTVILSGGRIDEDFAASFLERLEAECGSSSLAYIVSEGGVFFCQKHDMIPDLIVGDFDSVGTDCLEMYKNDDRVEIRTFRPEKDWTDTEIAVSAAIEKGCKKLWIMGGTGTRLDHVLGNIALLAMALESGVEAYLIDVNNRISLHDKPFTVERLKQWGHYVSFFPYGASVKELTLKGFKYETQKLELGFNNSRAISNEIEAEEASVTFEDGARILMIESKD